MLYLVFQAGNKIEMMVIAGWREEGSEMNLLTMILREGFLRLMRVADAKNKNGWWRLVSLYDDEWIVAELAWLAEGLRRSTQETQIPTYIRE